MDIFCTSYDSWKKDGRVIFENDHAYSILSVTPATPGHAIIISKNHAELLEQLRGHTLEGFIDAIPSTSLSIRALYDSDPEEIVHFYRSLKENPPTPASGDMARRMLEHKHLRVKPDTA